MEVEIKGAIGYEFKLIDLVSAVEANKDDKELTLLIDSPGGLTSEGWAMQSYIRSLNEQGYNTKAVGQDVMSIANVIYFECTEREAAEGAVFMWHNAWVDLEQGLDASDMRMYANYLDVEDSKIATFLADKTGLGLEAVKQLMEADTFVSYDQAQKLGFFNKSKQAFKIAAYSNKERMKTEKNKIKSAFTVLLSALGMEPDTANPGEGLTEPNAMELSLEDGTVLFIYSEDGEIEGKKVVLTEDGQPTETPAPDGIHKLEDGRSITVEGGMITSVEEIKEPEAMKEEEVVALIEATENRILETMTAKLKEQTEGLTSALIGQVSALAKEVKSNYDPAKVKSFSNGGAEPEEKQKPFNYGLKDVVKDIKAERLARRNK